MQKSRHSFNENYKELQCKILKLIDISKSAYIHKKKIIFLIKLLQNFTKLEINENHDILISHENDYFKSLFCIIKKMNEILLSVTKTTYFNFIIENDGNFLRNEIKIFIKDFNKYILKLSITNVKPLQRDKNQEFYNDLEDISQIITIIKNKLNDKSFSEDIISKLKIRLEEYKQIKSYESFVLEEDTDKVMKVEKVYNELKMFKKYIIKYEDFETQKRIGSGGYSQVWLCYNKHTGNAVALKKINEQNFTVKSFNIYRKEIELSITMNHFTIVKFIGFSANPPYCLLTEYIPGGSLYNRLHHGPKLDPSKLTIIALGIACGLQYMHENKYIHRDIKSLNILLDADDYPKICDFGMSRKLPDEFSFMTSNVGTIKWTAPEIFRGEKYDEKVDIYSYGIVLWELLTKESPYENLNPCQIFSILERNERPLIPQSCPSPLRKLITFCWDQDPNNRPSANEIVELFENGTITFPESDPKKVKVYIDQFLKTSKPSDKFDPDNASEGTAQSIADELSNSSTIISGLQKITRIEDIGLWVNNIIKTNIIETIIFRAQNCNDIQLAINIINALEKITSNDSLLKEFISKNGQKTFLFLFAKFGSTSIPKAIEILIRLVDKSNISFSFEHISNLASFLLANELNVRKLTIDLILKIVENKQYEDSSSLDLVASNLLLNIIPEALPLILTSILKLLRRFLDINNTKNLILWANGR